MNIVFILGETINGENPTTSSEIESAPKVKPEKHKDDLPIAVVSLLSQQLLLSLMCPNE